MGKQAIPLGQIDLPVTFRDPANYRIETLTFEVVGFHKTYHAILGQPCYTKFKAVPNYTYLKLKMLGPCQVIVIGTTFQHAYECEVECFEHASAIIASKAILPTNLDYGAPRVREYNKQGAEASLEDAMDQLNEACDVALLCLAKYQ
ncbi:uncharacterized protein [Miscanthus floridulus]|uniref:uncharacterized protein n=1 Tax=Miscanthus floridulus TaxID=154761 RepID=UPI00345B30C1